MIKVSIIIPVYNASDTIEHMLDSILIQSLKDFEVLMIDDGSTDESGRILDEYSAKDVRFKVFHKQNEGVAMARQLGIELANGEYCIHADADDWMEANMLEELYTKAKTEGSDVVIADYFINDNKNERLCRQQPTSLVPQQVLQNMFENRIFGSLWHKLIRTELYRKYDAKFFKGINHCEDLLIWVQLLQHPEVKVSYLPKAFYHYVVNDNSITRRFTRKTYNMRLRFRDKLNEILVVSNAINIIEKVSFGIFTEAFIYNVLSDAEISKGIMLYEKKIKQLRSLKWKLGFLFLKWGFKRVAHKLIYY
jgi:glycosyltransferase involved in cell wall biosynthesis